MDYQARQQLERRLKQLQKGQDAHYTKGAEREIAIIQQTLNK